MTTVHDSVSLVGSMYFENIINTLREPLLVLDADLRVEIANRAFLEAFDACASDTIGARLPELGGGSWDIPELQRLIGEVFSADEIFEGLEFTLDFPSIGVRTMMLNARRLQAHGADAASVLLAFEDVTEVRRAEAEQERLMQELSRSNAELERFAYVASHDLQEPLRMVSSYTQILARKYNDVLDERGLMYTEFAVDGARRMQALINGLLDYSRVGSRGSEFEVVDMDAIAALAIRNMQMSLQQAGAVLTVDPLPAVVGDPQQLLQAFQNLVSNAVKFRGDASPVVHIGAQADGLDTIFSVSDNGIGIEERYFEKMFIVFQRLHTRTEFPGNGIGLSITKRIVERHGGTIWVESQPGSGTTFFLRLRTAQGET